MNRPYILVVDDEPDIRMLVKEILEDEGCLVEVAKDGEHARQVLRERTPDLVLLDVWMPGIDGITLFKQTLAKDSNIPVIIMSGHGTVETAVEATRLGAYAFLEKPLSLNKLLPAVEGALASRAKKAEQSRLVDKRQTSVEIIGRSLRMQQLREQLQRVAKYDSPVLIQGEPGTGKALCARYLHHYGSQQDQPFIECHLAALPAQAMEAMLFGREHQGEVTPGSLEKAHGGSLYVANIESLPLAVQDRLIGYLKTGEFVRVAGTQLVKAPVRLICTTTCELEELVARGLFREDLYFLLKAAIILPPPLKAHSEDVPELINHIVDLFVARERLPYRHFGLPVQNQLRHYHWPGNVKELNNLVRQLLITGGQEEVTLDELGPLLSQPSERPPVMTDEMFELPLREARDRFEKAYFEYLMEREGGSVGKVAKQAGIERTHLYRKLRALGIEIKGGK